VLHNWPHNFVVVVVVVRDSPLTSWTLGQGSLSFG